MDLVGHSPLQELLRLINLTKHKGLSACLNKNLLIVQVENTKMKDAMVVSWTWHSNTLLRMVYTLVKFTPTMLEKEYARPSMNPSTQSQPSLMSKLGANKP